MNIIQRPSVQSASAASLTRQKWCVLKTQQLLPEAHLVAGCEGSTPAPRVLLVGRTATPAPHVVPSQRAGRVTPRATHTANAPTASGLEGGLGVGCRVVVPYHRTSHGQQLVLVGGCESLGNWDPKKGVKFTWCEGHSHVADVELPIHTTVLCKLVVLGENDSSTWEPETDRELTLAPSTLVSRAAGYTILAHWGFPSYTQVLTNSLRRGTSLSGRSSPNSHTSSSSSGAAGFLAGVKKVLAQASSLDRAVIPGISAWDEEPTEHEEEVGLVECQVTVLVPKNGPQLKSDQSLVLVGGSAALGRWDAAEGLPLERSGEDSAMWTARAELPLGEGLQAKVVVVDTVTGKAQIWEPCENRSLAQHRGSSRPVMITAYWGAEPTHSMEVDRLSVYASASDPQVVAMLRQQLAATSTQLDGMRRERDDARKVVAAGEEQMRHLQMDTKPGDKTYGRFEMVQLAEQLQTTRRLYESTKKEASELGGALGVTRQLCDVAKNELRALGSQLEAAKRAYDALAPQVEIMEKRLSSTNRAFESTRPELVALEAQLDRARSLFDRTLSKIEAAKGLTAGGVELQQDAVRRRVDSRVRQMQFAKL